MIYVLDGVKTYISAQLEATLLAIEAELAITVERWKTLETSESKNLQFPLIEILPKTVRPEYGADESPLTEHWEYYGIDIEIGIAGQDTTKIQRDLLAYREALVRIVEGDMSFGGLYNRVRIGLAEFSPLIEAVKEKKLVKLMRQALEVRKMRE